MTTALEKLRMEAGVSTTEMAEELGISEKLYIRRELGTAKSEFKTTALHQMADKLEKPIMDVFWAVMEGKN